MGLARSPAEPGRELVDATPVIDLHRLYTSAPSQPPDLVIDRSDLPATARALGVHLQALSELFERGPSVVKIVRTAESDRSAALNMHSTVIAAHAVCRPVIERVVRGQLVREPVTLPNRVAMLYLNLSGSRGLPNLRGICAAPLLTDDGAIRCDAGYDRSTGFWCTGVQMPSLPDHPTLEDAQQSLELIRSTIATFPFADAERVRPSTTSIVDLSK